MKMDPAAAEYMRNMSGVVAIREAEDKGDSEIQQLYRGAVVFITGGTGFLGKQLIEKLLRACNGIVKIYLLTRSKKGKTMEERLANTFEDPVFGPLKNINPDFHKIIIPVEGDIKELKLGIQDEIWKSLTEEVNFIYHVAATVLFNEPLKSAINANVRGTREVITLARQCRNLKSMVHVSTAFVHCNRKSVLEKFYPSPVSPATIIEMVEHMEENRLDAMTPTLIEGWPNTYTFSKAIAEEAVRVMGVGLPICVVRPAIVIPTSQEPVPGWLDLSNVFGPSGLMLGIGIGFLHIGLLNEYTQLDVVPVDYVNNLIIASSWETNNMFQRGAWDVQIYTISRIRNRINWGTLQNLSHQYGLQYISPKTIWYPCGITTTNKTLFLLLTIIFHLIPAFFIDCILMAVGQKLRVSRIYKKAYKLNTVLSHFLLNSWDFHDDNTQELRNKLAKSDQIIFNFDITDIETTKFLMGWWIGLRKYIIKDGLKGTEKTRKRHPLMRIVNYIVVALYFFLLWKVLSWTFTIPSLFYYKFIAKYALVISKHIDKLK